MVRACSRTPAFREDLRAVDMHRQFPRFHEKHSDSDPGKPTHWTLHTSAKEFEAMDSPSPFDFALLQKLSIRLEEDSVIMKRESTTHPAAFTSPNVPPHRLTGGGAPRLPSFLLPEQASYYAARIHLRSWCMHTQCIRPHLGTYPPSTPSNSGAWTILTN
jgi:hypothetical protein